MSHILLTGASGFVGKYFIDKYAKSYDIETFSFLEDDFSALHVRGVYLVGILNSDDFYTLTRLAIVNISLRNI